jgi:hypothetical protein
MELLIALMITIGAITTEEGSLLKGNEGKTIQMAQESGISQSKIDDARTGIIISEEADF